MDMHRARLDKYERAGYSYGQSTAGMVYILATVLERVDNDFLWSVRHSAILSVFTALTENVLVG